VAYVGVKKGRTTVDMIRTPISSVQQRNSRPETPRNFAPAFGGFPQIGRGLGKAELKEPKIS